MGGVDACLHFLGSLGAGWGVGVRPSVGNGYPVPGLQYLAFPWRDSETAVLIDAQGRNIEEICQFIRKAQKAEEGVLVQSLLGRCSVLLWLIDAVRFLLFC